MILLTECNAIRNALELLALFWFESCFLKAPLPYFPHLLFVHHTTDTLFLQLAARNLKQTNIKNEKEAYARQPQSSAERIYNQQEPSLTVPSSIICWKLSSSCHWHIYIMSTCGSQLDQTTGSFWFLSQAPHWQKAIMLSFSFMWKLITFLHLAHSVFSPSLFDFNNAIPRLMCSMSFIFDQLVELAALLSVSRRHIWHTAMLSATL